MKVAIAGLFVFAAAGLAQTVEFDFLSGRDLMDSDDMFEDHEFWARDAEPDLEDWMDDILDARDAGSEDDGAITTILWTREAKKHKADPNWTAPKINIPPGDKVIKNTFKCNAKKEQCSGEIQLQAPARK